MTEIIIALIGLIGVLGTAFINKRSKRKVEARAEQAECEVNLQRAALNFGSFLQEWSGTYQEIEHLLNTTPIDRFIIFRAWNGALYPRWTTAVIQIRKGEQAPIAYVHFELDVDYVSRLKEISNSNTVVVNTKALADGVAIKDVYLAEGVHHAVWSHISSDSITGKGSVSHVYCSFATHSEEPLDQSVVTRCSILAGRLKGVAMTFNEK